MATSGETTLQPDATTSTGSTLGNGCSCGWDPDAGISGDYVCTSEFHGDEDPEGAFLFECPPGVAGGAPCEGTEISFEGCCNPLGEAMFCNSSAANVWVIVCDAAAPPQSCDPD